MLRRLKLKDKSFTPFFPASEADIDALWNEVVRVDSTLNREESITTKKLPGKKDLHAFLQHCCTRRHYCFQIKKCGSDNCTICRSPRLPQQVFDSLGVVPDPVPTEHDPSVACAKTNQKSHLYLMYNYIHGILSSRLTLNKWDSWHIIMRFIKNGHVRGELRIMTIMRISACPPVKRNSWTTNQNVT